MGKRKFNITEQDLIHMYVKDKISSYLIAEKLGMSETHALRLLHKYKIPLRSTSDAKKLWFQRENRTGRFHCRFVGWKINGHGYHMTWVEKHPNRNRHGYVPTHRLVMEKKLGRYLKSNEHVHHIDGNKLNYKRSNLFILTPEQHSGYRSFLLKKFTNKETFKQYRKEREIKCRK